MAGGWGRAGAEGGGGARRSAHKLPVSDQPVTASKVDGEVGRLGREQLNECQ